MNRLGTAVATTITAAAAVVAVAGIALLTIPARDAAVMLAVVTSLGLVGVPLVGRALVRSDARSVLGWVLVLAGSATVCRVAFDAYARIHFSDGVELPHPALAEFASDLMVWGQLSLTGLAPLLLTGRLPAGRWWRVAACGALALAALSVLVAFGSPFGHFDTVANPFGPRGDVGELLGDLGWLIVLGQNVVNVTAVRGVSAAIRQLPPGAPATVRRALGDLRIAVRLVAASYLSCIVFGLADLVPVAYGVEHLALLVFGVTAWLAIRRSGLLDARQVIERALRYGVLAAAVVAAYLATAALVRAVIGGVLPELVAVALSAALALLLRDVAQRGVARLVWGPLRDPAVVLGRLGARLDAAARPGDVLLATTQTLREALRVERVDVADSRSVVLASSGGAGGERPTAMPLVFAGAPVGMLLVTSTDPDGLSHRQRRLLTTVLPQLAAAVQAVTTGEALEASRQRMVRLRESERQRIRSDLHDGLGPALAGITWGIERAADSIDDDPAAGRAALAYLAADARSVVGEVRRIVHDLVPSRVEEVGFATALTHDAAGLGASVEIESGVWRQRVPSLVEVSAYRIALEAVTNATRHADAATVVVRIGTTAPEGAHGALLTVSVEDDGRGFASDAVDGIGLRSMRRRAEECGGRLTIGPAVPHGTVMRVLLPIDGEPTTNDAAEPDAASPLPAVDRTAPARSGTVSRSASPLDATTEPIDVRHDAGAFVERV